MNRSYALYKVVKMLLKYDNCLQNCSLPGEYPFYFNEVQGISYSADDGELYASFSTPE